jgi:hypothetical protein
MAEISVNRVGGATVFLLPYPPVQMSGVVVWNYFSTSAIFMISARS